MNTNLPQNQDNQEIDLMQISQKINKFFKSINKKIFNAIQFFIKNRIIVLSLLVLGLAVGFYLDKKAKTYFSEIIVTPNFESMDYLQSKIVLIKSKIEENDTVFLKEVVGIANPKVLKEISITPIVDVYNFIKGQPENFELIKVMAEDGNVKSVLEESMTSKNYNFQKIFLDTNKKISSHELVDPILKFLNSSDYYSKIKQETHKNIHFELNQSDSIIKQIDGILNNVTISRNSFKNNDKLMFYNENMQLNDIIKTKESLIRQQSVQKTYLIGTNKIIKENSVILNIEEPKYLNGLMKVFLPLFLISMFVISKQAQSFYRKLKLQNEV
ncbi:hypothetical protein [Flavobacterium crassostreae]|uniref:Uncharacterized protein n=1 Tax=Flavobacterium crassostreae TaxID=1763534 RepID=A0A1B9E5H1_9FLAO|nr:hypothetical protein [Flavobacterium crassostreae]OCB77210.1 hypothetical protein LPBF_04205 [Flavobacterium crassostreae]